MAQAVITQTKDMLNSFHQNALLTRPEGRRLTQLEHEMANVLARTDLSDRQKMEQFSHTLQNFQKVRGVIIDNGLMMTSTNSTVIPPEEEEEEESQAETVFSRIQEVIKEALQNEKVNTPPAQPTSNIKPLKATSNVKLKKPLKSAVQPLEKRQTRAAARKFAQQLENTPISHRWKALKDSGIEYTPLSRPRSANPKKLIKKTVNGHGSVNFDAW